MLTDDQNLAQTRVLDELEQREIRLVRLERTQYARTPWPQLRKAVASSDGIVVFGFRQLHVEVGVWRPNTDEMRSGDGWYATAWNQIEAGIAIMAMVPVLVVADPGVEEGVFAPDVWGEKVFGVRQRHSAEWDAASAEAFEGWAATVAERALKPRQ